MGVGEGEREERPRNRYDVDAVGSKEEPLIVWMGRRGRVLYIDGGGVLRAVC